MEYLDFRNLVTEACNKMIKEFLWMALHWYNYDDLDLHMDSPYGHIYYGNKADLLDVDMNACGGSAFEERNNPKKFSCNAVENIIFSGIPKAGTYKVFVNNFAKVENIDLGFEAQWSYSYLCV